MKAEIKSTPHIVCPHCGDASFACSHILNGEWRQFGPWYCDQCGHAITGKLTPDGIEIEAASERRIETADLLILRPQEKPVYFIVKGGRFEGGPTVADKMRRAVAKLQGTTSDEKNTVTTAAEEHEHKKFYYESHSCPTNWFKPTTVYYQGDDDPHGLIEFVATRDWTMFPEDENVSPNDHDREMVNFIEAHRAEEPSR